MGLSPLRISVISLFYNRRELSRQYLEYWRKNRGAFDKVELLFGDAGSSDGTRDLLNACRHFSQVEFFETNLGFSRGNNRLASRARGGILVFLNNDTVPCEGWLQEIEAVFASKPEVGVVGNLQFSVSTRLVDHAGVFFDRDGKPVHFRPPVGTLQSFRWMPVPAVTGACFAIRRSVFESLGGFDENFVNGYEDTDLCMRARAQGRDIFVATRSHVWHYVASSPGRHLRELENEERFLSRWKNDAVALSAWSQPDLREAQRVPCRALNDFGRLQVFFPAEGGHNEEQSRRLLLPYRRWTRIEIPIPAGSLQHPFPLRLDPLEQCGTIEVGGISFSSSPTAEPQWHCYGVGLESCCHAAGTSLPMNGRPWRAESTGEDPQVLVTLPYSLSPPDGNLTLTIWLRVFPSASQAMSAAPKREKNRKILVDIWSLQPGGSNGGIKVWAFQILEGLASFGNSEFELTAVVSPSLAPELEAVGFPISLLVVDSETYLNGLREKVQGFDAIYAPLGWSALAQASITLTSLLVDLLHRDLPGMLPKEEVYLREKRMVEVLAQAQAVQCNSLFVRQTLCREYGAGEMRLFVAYNAVGSRLSKGVFTKVNGRYFLYPANTWRHKNHERLLLAYEQYRASTSEPWELWLTGSRVGGWTEGLPEARELPQGVKWLGFLDSESYRAAFGGAGALVFPSLYEGFGIPVLEARVLGIPIACSTAGSLPEVAQGNAVFFDPLSTEAIETALKIVSTPPPRVPVVPNEDFQLGPSLARIAAALR